MIAVILCGGAGTRIRDVNEALPKPMLPIGGQPIVWHIMKGFAAHGVNDFVLALGYKGWLIKEFFLNYRAMMADCTVRLGRDASVTIEPHAEDENWRVTLSDTGETTMTGGRVAALRRYLEGEGEFLLTYGDGVSDVDIGALLAFHRAHGKIATVTAVRPAGRFGELRLESDLVTEFNEKPQAAEGYINGGFFVFDAKRIWDYLGNDPETPLERQPLQALARDHQLAAFRHDGFWQPMDTLREFNILNDLWSHGKAPWKSW